MTYIDGLLSSLTRVKKARSLRASSWDTTGRNSDAWNVEPGETRVIADIQGPGCINHIWMTQPNGYRNVLIQMFWDDEEHPSVLCPLGDFFGLGNEIVNSYDSIPFSASTHQNNTFNTGCALNSYLQMLLTAAQGSNSSTKATQPTVNTSMLIMNCTPNHTVRISPISMPNSIVKTRVTDGDMKLL